MAKVELDALPGFDFSNSIRNVAMDKMGVQPVVHRSTGTTIVACVSKVSFYQFVFSV